ncbi:hypothetical protein QUF80_20010 [Desulfococcaceae bacterium HSG8]|nr:hypothetical protein [Desulfococcaceae bacterium HSG8]
MKTELQQTLSGIEVTEPSVSGMLQVFGLRWAITGDLFYITLDEALADETLEITEVSEGGEVPTLMVINNSGTMIFLMAGEQLIGAKQNRVLNVSLMIAAHGKVPIPVSCTEQKRWSYRSRKFHSSGSISHGRLRRQMAEDVYDGYHTMCRPVSKQDRVWSEVNRKLNKMNTLSGSDALEQVYEDHQAKIEDTIRDVRVPEGCCGAVFAFNGKIAGMDIFDKPSTLSKLLPKLIRGYAIDAMEEKSTDRVSREAVKDWICSVTEAQFDSFESPGLGFDIRIRSGSLIGDSLLVDECPVHVELFPGAR